MEKAGGEEGMGKRWMLWLLVSALWGLSLAQGTSQEGASPVPSGNGSASQVVRLDAGTTPLPLASVFRSLAASAGYTALVADIPEERRVVVRRLELPLEEAVRFLVGTFLGEEYGYGILPDRKLLVVGKRRNLETLVANALRVDFAPQEKGAGAKDRGEESGEAPKGEAPPPPAAYRVFAIPPQVDPDSVAGLNALFPSLRPVFVRTLGGPLLVVSGPEKDLEAFAHLWQKLEEGWRSSPPQAPQGGAPQAEEGDYFFPLPQAKQEEVEALLSAATTSARVQVFPRQVYCRGAEAECARVERLLRAAFPEGAEVAEKPTPEPLFLHAYPVYGNPEEVAEAVRQTLGERLREEGGNLHLAKDARQLVLRASRGLHQEVYALLEKIDPPLARRSEPSPVAQASYRPLYAEAAFLAGELRARFPELKVEVKEGAWVVFEGSPELVRQAASFVQDQDRPKPQVVYRVIVFATNDRYAQDLNASLTAALQAGITLSIDSLLRAGGVLPPSPNAASSLSAALEMAERKGWGRSILNTTLVAVDNEEAFLQSGGKVAVLTASGDRSGGGENGGEQPAQPAPAAPLEYDYGLILRVKPKVLSTSLVQTTVSLEISDEPTLGGNVLRYTRKRTEGQYLIPPGGILAIGGVLSTRETRSREGIPLLMDIPILGALFSRENHTVSSEYLLIYLVPEAVSYPPSQAEPPSFRQLPREEAPSLPPRRSLPQPSGTGREIPSPQAPLPASLPSPGTLPPAPSSPGEEGYGTPRPIRAEVRRTSGGTLLRFLEEAARPQEIRVEGAWYRLLPAPGGFWALLAPLEAGRAYQVRMPGGEVIWAVFAP